MARFSTFNDINKHLTQIVEDILADYEPYKYLSIGNHGELIICAYGDGIRDTPSDTVAKIITYAANKGYKLIVVDAAPSDENVWSVFNYTIGVKSYLLDNNIDWEDPGDFTTEHIIKVIKECKLEKHILAKLTEIKVRKAHE